MLLLTASLVLIADSVKRVSHLNPGFQLKLSRLRGKFEVLNRAGFLLRLFVQPGYVKI